MSLFKYFTFCESYTMGEITFGFELEAYYKNMSLEKDFQAYTLGFFNGGEFKKDISIHPITDPEIDFDSDPDDLGFEYNSPPMNLTPENILKLLKYLQSLNDKGVRTNQTCGFHIHFGLPIKNKKMLQIEYIWMLCKLAFDEEMLTEVNYLNEINLFSAAWAEVGYLRNLKTIINQIVRGNDSAKETLQEVLSPLMKMRTFRLHPQGTLEWRGPRDFMNYGNTKLIKKFLFEKLIPFSKWMRSLDDTIETEYGTFHKDDLFDIYKEYSSYINDKNKIDNRFSEYQNRMTLAGIFKQYPQLSSMKFENAQIEMRGDKLIFLGAKFNEGVWDIENSEFDSYMAGGEFKAGKFLGSMRGGKWFDGIWKGVWHNGQIYSRKFDQYVASQVSPKSFYSKEKSAKTIEELNKMVEW